VSTNSEQLKTTLDQLRKELSQIDAADPALREQLAQALAEIQTALQSNANPAGPPATPQTVKAPSLIKKLRETAERFEASHPALADNIGSLIDTLSRSGI
jgi:Domain of unknown function (DUF4404)